jgi:hypothetical protein
MNLRTRVMVIGGVIGGLVGAGAAYLYLRSTPVEVDEEGRERLPTVQPGKALTVTLGVLTVLRQVVGLGQAEEKGHRRRG